MPKKVKSFAMEEEPYEELFKIFKNSDAEVNISYCINKYVKDLLRYIKPIDEALNKEPSGYSVPLAFIIETKAREPLFRFLDGEPSAGGGESSLAQELRELQMKYDEHIKKNPPTNNDMAQELGKRYPIGALLKFLAKMAIEDTKNLGSTPDDRFRESALEVGGMELVRFLREKVVPAFEKIDPDVMELVGKAKSPKNKATKED
jgi:hypothetical protein